jgi:hypothetical protein
MAYNKNNLEKKILIAIRKYKIVFKEEIYAKGLCAKQTFYNLELDKIDSIKEAIENNKANIKSALRKKWAISGNATMEISLYKLICDDEERRALSMQQIDVTSKGERITGIDYIVPDENKNSSNL